MCTIEHYVNILTTDVLWIVMDHRILVVNILTTNTIWFVLVIERNYCLDFCSQCCLFNIAPKNPTKKNSCQTFVVTVPTYPQTKEHVALKCSAIKIFIFYTWMTIFPDIQMCRTYRTKYDSVTSLSSVHGFECR